MSNPQFDHEKLDVYQRSLEFIAWVTPLLASIKESAAATREIRDQLDRAQPGAAAAQRGRRQQRVPEVGMEARDDHHELADEARGSRQPRVGHR